MAERQRKRRIPLRRLTVVWLACLAIITTQTFAQTPTDSAPDNDWKIAAPEEVGMDSTPLAEMIDFARARDIPVHSVQIVRHGRLVLDAYFYPYHSGMRHDVASVTKSITSTQVGLAIQRGHLRDAQQPVVDLFPSRSIAALDARKRALTLEHLLTMQAGWDCGFEPNEARLFEMRRSADWPQFMLDLPMVAHPGIRWAYCSGNCHLLSAILAQAAKTNVLAFARRELFEPLGIIDVVWPADTRGDNHGWGDLQLHPRDMAKLGQLFLQRGRWGGQQVLSETWIREATRAHVKQTGNRDHYGYFWWVKGKDYPGMFEAVGRGGQRINVWPAKNLVLVFTGGGFGPGDLATFILKSMKSDGLLPANPAAMARLKEKLAAATRPPPPLKTTELPAMAGTVSGKTYALSGNELDLSALSFRFAGASEAAVRLTRLGQDLHCPIGLDGVKRFSTNTLAGLPFAAKGQWLGDDTFLLQLDRVAGISCYELTVKFAQAGASIGASIKERTGLKSETFTGKALP